MERGFGFAGTRDFRKLIVLPDNVKKGFGTPIYTLKTTLRKGYPKR
jgi:hypothetical protein